MQRLKLADDPYDKPMTEEDLIDMRKHLKKLGIILISLGFLSILSILFRLIPISLFAVVLFIPVGILTILIKKRFMFICVAITLFVVGIAQILGGVVVFLVPYTFPSLTTYPGLVFFFFGGWAIKDFKDFS
jgi:4-hydroxybenzoate polyprenyltransferase